MKTLKLKTLALLIWLIMSSFIPAKGAAAGLIDPIGTCLGDQQKLLQNGTIWYPALNEMNDGGTRAFHLAYPISGTNTNINYYIFTDRNGGEPILISDDSYYPDAYLKYMGSVVIPASQLSHCSFTDAPTVVAPQRQAPQLKLQSPLKILNK